MGSIVTTIVVFLLICSNSPVALANTQPQNNSNSIRSNTVKKVRQDRNLDNSDDQENPDNTAIPGKPQGKNKKNSLDFSDTGRPGQQTAGESRGEACIYTERNLEAVIPASHSGKTTLGHPRFWVYFPYGRQQVTHVEFIIQNEARKDIWRSQIQTDNRQGYQSFSMPKTVAPLKVGRWYRWYVKVYCDSQLASSEYVQGWVRRVPLLSQVYLELQQEPTLSHQIYGNHGIWYDAIDRLLALYRAKPGNLSLEQDWQNLIKAKGVSLHSLPEVEASYEALE